MSSRAVLAADAVWDVLLGIAFILVPCEMVAHRLGFTALGPWLLFAVLAVGCFGYATLLARASTGVGEIAAFSRLTAAINAVGALIAVALVAIAEPPLALTIGLLVAAFGCVVFAALEWRVPRSVSGG